MYDQMEKKTWLKCIIVTDKPDVNCCEYKLDVGAPGLLTAKKKLDAT